MDEKELERIDLCHVKYGALLDKRLFLAPIVEDPARILDLGCGTGKRLMQLPRVLPSGVDRETGIWCVDMAEEYPGAQVSLSLHAGPALRYGLTLLSGRRRRYCPHTT